MSRGALIGVAMLAAVACDKQPPKPLTPNTIPAVTPVAAQPRAFIDVHTHTNPFAYKLAIERLGPMGLRRLVNLSGGSSPEMRAENLAAANKFPGQVLLFYNLAWQNVEDPAFAVQEAAMLERAVELGFAGVKVSKALGLGIEIGGKLIAPDDERLAPIWDKAGELGVPIAIHTSDPKAFFEPTTPQNERYAELSLAPNWSFYGDEYPARAELLAARDRLLARHPKTTFILVHLGNNPEDVDYVDALLDTYPNAYVDIAARVGEFGRHPASRMKAFFEKHADRVMFGTDIMMGLVPMKNGRAALRLTLGSISEEPPTLEDVPGFYENHFRYFETTGAPIEHPVPIQGDWKVNPIGLSGAVLDKIYWKNAERVVAAPWLGRRAGHAVHRTARELQSAGPVD